MAQNKDAKRQRRWERVQRKKAQREAEAPLLILRDRTNRRIKTASNLGGATVGVATAYYTGMLEGARGIGHGLGEAYEGARAAYNLLNGGSAGGNEYVIRYVNQLEISEEQKQAFFKRQEKGYLEKVTQASSMTLEGLQRGAEKTPGAQSEPVKGVRSLKEQIFKWTMPWKDNEEKEIRGTEQYTKTYNQRAQILQGLTIKAGELEKTIKDQSQKIADNESIGNKRPEGREILGGLIKEYNGVMKTIEDFSGLTVKEINQGQNNEQYLTLTKQAKGYGITPGQVPAFWGDVGFYGSAILVALIGKKVLGGAINAGARAIMTPGRMIQNRRLKRKVNGDLKTQSEEPNQEQQ